jgi:hypothetical protein
MVELIDLDAPSRLPSYEELSVLSLDAAIELDQIRRGDSDIPHLGEASTATGRLIDNLGFRSKSLGTVEAFQRLADPRTVDIYNRAVFHLTKIHTNTMEELASAVQKYIVTFVQNAGPRNSADLAQMRDFCLALHRELLAETYSRFGESGSELI